MAACGGSPRLLAVTRSGFVIPAPGLLHYYSCMWKG